MLKAEEGRNEAIQRNVADENKQRRNSHHHDHHGGGGHHLFTSQPTNVLELVIRVLKELDQLSQGRHTVGVRTERRIGTGAAGLEPAVPVLETGGLPLTDAPKIETSLGLFVRRVMTAGATELLDLQFAPVLLPLTAGVVVVLVLAIRTSHDE